MDKYNTVFENGSWTCDCPHFKYKHTDCRHILKKKLEQRGIPKGVRETSIDAYCEIISDPDNLQSRYQDIIITLFNSETALTDNEITRCLGFDDPNRVRPRRFELVNDYYKPFIQECGKRVCSISGRRVFAWELTDQGRLLARDLLHLDKSDAVVNVVWEPQSQTGFLRQGIHNQTTLFPEV